MFVPCPHCQFLVACPPQRGAQAPVKCPRCGRSLDEEAVAEEVAGVADAGESPAIAEAAPAEPEPAPAPAAAADPATPPGRSAFAFGRFALPLLGRAKPAPVPVPTDADEEVDAVFDAVEVELESEPEPESDPISADPDPVEATDDEAFVLTEETTDTTEPAPFPLPMLDTAQPTAAVAAESASPAFAAQPGRRGWARLRWPLIALLALLLVLQVLIADRARLAADPGWRPLVEKLCGALGCTLPAWHEPSAFTMLDRQVRPTERDGALRVDATFRNDARWAQDWPALQLALSDADGRVLGSQVFAPDQYLGAAPTTRLAPGQSAQVAFLVQEPAPGTVAFSFEFR